MKRLTALAVALLCANRLAYSQSTVYWDINGATAGAGGASPSGTWSTSVANWNSASAGTSATANWTTAAAGNNPQFSAGTDATGPFTVTVVGSVNVATIRLEEGGSPTITGGTINLVHGVGVNSILAGIVTGVSTPLTIDSKLSGVNGFRIARNLANGNIITIGSTANDFTGGVSINSGMTLRLGTAGVIPDGNLVSFNTAAAAAVLDLNNQSETVGSVTYPSGTTATLSLGSGTLTLSAPAGETFAGPITGSGGSLTKSGSGNITLSGATLSASGTLSLNTGGTMSLTSASSFTLGFTSISVGAGTTLDFAGTAGTKTVGGAISGSGTVSKTGVSILTLSGNNSGFSGGITLTDGRINFNNANASGTGTITVGSAADEFVVSSGTVVIGNSIVLNTGANPLFYSTSGNSIEQTGQISGLGGLTRDDNGAGTVRFSGANTYSGGFTIKSRAIRLNNKLALGSGTITIGDAVTAPANAITLNADQALTGANALTNAVTWNQNFTLAAVNSLELSGNAAMTGTRTATVNSGVTLTLSGVVSGSGAALTKAGVGTLALVGANTYDGATTVNAGTLLVNGSIAAGAVAVNSAGKLGGTGTVNGTVTVNAGGTLAPGTSVGTLTLASPPSLGGTNQMEVDRNGGSPTADKLVVSSGTLTYGGVLNIVNLGAPYQVGDTFDLFDASSFSGSFTSINPPIPAPGFAWDTSQLTVSGSISVVAAQPPSISVQPANMTTCEGQTGFFSVTASGGTCSPSYFWSKHENLGWGSAWVATGGGGTFRSTSTGDNFGDPACTSLSSANDINSPSGNALGIYGGPSGDEVVTRSFPNLSPSHVISIDFDNGNIDNGKTNGFALQSFGVDVLQFYFIGGQTTYKYNDGTERDTGIGFQRTGIRVQVVLGAGNTYGLIITPCGGPTTNFNGTFSQPGLNGLKLFNQNTSGGSDYDIYFNNFIIASYVDNADNYSGGGAWAGLDKGDQPIGLGNGNSTYTIPITTASDNGTQYQVVVASCGGTVLSTTATLTVTAPLTAVVSGSATNCFGESVQISAALTGTGPWNVWWSDGVLQLFVASSPATRLVSPLTTTVYTVTNLNDANCVAQFSALTGSATITPNIVTANSASYSRGAGSSLKIYITNLLANTSSSVGQAITFLGVGTDGFNLTSTNGVTLTTNATFIGYPASAGNVNDSFTYKVVTSQGCTNYGTVLINAVANPAGIAQSINTSGGTVTVDFSGIPNYQYVVERAEDVGFSVNATNLSTNVAPANGQFSITDTSPPQPTGYYRLRYSP